MAKFATLLTVAGIALLFTTSASADIAWTLTGVTFNNGDALTGSFTTDNGVTMYTGSSIVITGPNAFSVAGLVDSYLPSVIGIYSPGWSNYIDLYLSAPLTSAGGAIGISSGYDCPGCGVLNSGAQVSGSPAVPGGGESSAPEPGLYGLLAFGMTWMLFAIRRRPV